MVLLQCVLSGYTPKIPPMAAYFTPPRRTSNSHHATGRSFSPRHLKTVERIIGFKRGTGGSSRRSQFLRKALELTFFPELLDVRTHIGA